MALVTGGGRGIGAATSLALCARGWSVLAIDAPTHTPHLDEPHLGYDLCTPEELEATGARGGEHLETASADVSDPARLAEVVADLVQRRGRLDAAIACAGVIVGGVPLWEQDAEALAVQRAINFDAVVELARLTIPHLLARPEPRSGRFVAVASAAAAQGLAGLSAYGATKAGVTGLIRGLAADLADSGITANAVAPGSTRTAMLDASADAYGLANVEAFAGHAPQRRLLDPAEVAAAICWLCSAEAQAVTGVILPVDGGMTA